jgi:hypothetical protein
MNQKLPDVHFDASKGGYWLRLPDGRYITLGKSDLNLHLRAAGVEGIEQKGGELSALERFYLLCQQERYVDYAGPLAGHQVGVLDVSGKRVLVTSQARQVEPKEGKTQQYDRFLTQLLPGDQSLIFCLWLKMARRSLKLSDYRPGHALVVAGAPGGGKSFLQKIVTDSLGGRHVLPFDWMTGRTPFNGELAGGEHWQVEDKQATSDIRSRKHFGQTLKECVANRFIQIHGKNKEAIPLPVFRRVTITLNCEPENLLVLPPFEDSLWEKIIMLKSEPTNCLSSDYAENGKTFGDELPAFLHYVDSLRVPKRFVHVRYGLKAWHHPELVCALTEMTPEQQLWEWIDSFVIQKLKPNEFWRGTAAELKAELMNTPNRLEVDRLLYYTSSCGVFLSRLALRIPERVKSVKNEGKTFWKIL